MPNVKWLAGFFDAEGSVSFNYKPNIDIVNTSSRTMFQIKDVLSRMGMELELHYREKPSKSSKKPRWDIALRHDDQIKLFIQNVIPYVHGKRFQLELVNEWYRNPTGDLKKKLQFANQVKNIIVSRPEKVLQKLQSDRLDIYDDIPVLTDEDSQIITLPVFNDLDYLAGLIDGDGTFNIHHRAAKHSKNKRYTPQILFNNTNKEIVKRYCSVLTNNHLTYHIDFATRGKTTNRRRWDVVISGVKRSKKVCSLIKEHLETKKDQCDLLLQYCRHRESNPKSYNELGFETKTALQEMHKGIY